MTTSAWCGTAAGFPQQCLLLGLHLCCAHDSLPWNVVPRPSHGRYCNPRGPKTIQTLQNRPKTTRNHFGWVWEKFWDVLSCVLEGFWDPCVSITAAPWPCYRYPTAVPRLAKQKAGAPTRATFGFPASLKAKMKIKKPRLRAGTGPKHTVF